MINNHSKNETQRMLKDITDSLQRSLDHEKSGNHSKSIIEDDGNLNVYYMLGYYEQTIKSALLNVKHLSKCVEELNEQV